NRKFASVLAFSAQIAADTHGPGFGLSQVRFPLGSMRIGPSVRNQDFDISSQQFKSLVAEQFLYARIDQLDPALLVDHDDSVRRGFEKNAQVLLLRHNALDLRVQQRDD